MVMYVVLILHKCYRSKSNFDVFWNDKTRIRIVWKSQIFLHSIHGEITKNISLSELCKKENSLVFYTHLLVGTFTISWVTNCPHAICIIESLLSVAGSVPLLNRILLILRGFGSWNPSFAVVLGLSIPI